MSELNKNEKIILLESIAAKEVDPLKLNEDTFVGIEETDWYFVVNISHARSEARVPTNIIYLGEAKKSMELFSLFE